MNGHTGGQQPPPQPTLQQHTGALAGSKRPGPPAGAPSDASGGDGTISRKQQKRLDAAAPIEVLGEPGWLGYESLHAHAGPQHRHFNFKFAMLAAAMFAPKQLTQLCLLLSHPPLPSMPDQRCSGAGACQRSGGARGGRMD